MATIMLDRDDVLALAVDLEAVTLYLDDLLDLGGDREGAWPSLTARLDDMRHRLLLALGIDLADADNETLESLFQLGHARAQRWLAADREQLEQLFGQRVLSRLVILTAGEA